MENNEERNLIVNLNDPELINQDIKNSNEIYNKGYIPYFARRRVNLNEGEENEIVNDESVEFEFARLYQYNNRDCASLQHIHDLIDYMKTQGTIFVPWVLYNPDEVKKSGNEYRHANMVWEILIKYINTICDKVSFTYIFSGEEYHMKTKDVLKHIEKFILKKDLIDFLMTALKFGYNPKIARIISILIYKLYDGESKLTDIIHEDILERLVVYTLVNSKKEDMEKKYIKIAHNLYPNLIIETAIKFKNYEASIIDLSLIPFEFLCDNALQLMKNEYEILDDIISYNNENMLRMFAERAMSKLKSNKEKFEFQINIMQQKGFIMPNNIKIESLFPINKPDVTNIEKYYEKYHDKRYPYINQCTYLYIYAKSIFLSARPPLNPSISWISTDNLKYTEGLSIALIKIINTESEINFRFYDYLVNAMDNFMKVIKYKLNKLNDEEKDKIHKFNEFQVYTRIILKETKFTFGKNYSLLKKIIEEYPEISKYILDLVPEFLNNKNYELINIIPDDKIDILLENGCKLDELMKCLNMEYNFEWIKNNYGTYFVELPEYLFSNARYRTLSREIVEWSMKVLTEEQQQNYVFSIQTMRENKDIFENLVCIENVDRFIEAFGINWVERRTPISISDIVNSNSYVNSKVIERYLDIILLDEELRNKMLENKEVCEIIVLDNLIEKIMKANNFTNEIKCEVLFRLFKHNVINEKEFSALDISDLNKIEHYLIGSGYIGRALIGIICYKFPKKFEKYLSSNIFDIKEEVVDNNESRR